MNRYLDLLTGKSFRLYNEMLQNQKSIPGKQSKQLQDLILDSMTKEAPKVLLTQAATAVPIVGFIGLWNS